MIARALIHNPKILILDEPTAGVDISLRRSMWELLSKLNREGLTIILTTHYLEEAETLCDQIAIIDKGKLIENEKTDKLLDKLHIEGFLIDTKSFVEVEDENPFQIKYIQDNKVEAYVNNEQTISDLFDYLKQHKIVVDRIKNKANRLEELFIRMVND